MGHGYGQHVDEPGGDRNLLGECEPPKVTERVTIERWPPRVEAGSGYCQVSIYKAEGTGLEPATPFGARHFQCRR